MKFINFQHRDRSHYSIIFLACIACQYVVFELPENLLEHAQALLVDYTRRRSKFGGRHRA
ncbi:protein of unknown function [Methylotuvimicrobium alcaliphilum 20Z]|uniref:Uncharacterized protein n=1 Tax=Methylotuvimicrobium alcaliphilum (strain DSM 19304 / NCIMB 14124 / VKM B-2133 / 20Z) TaxID=1091494 RepID=G4T016_META2|nr:protein of unknown function [Methylotuvimicrobium alcaliphilum 20Z]